MTHYRRDYVTATERGTRKARTWLTELLPIATWDWSGCTDTGDISAATTCTTRPPRRLSISSPAWELCTTPGSTSRNFTWGTTMTSSGRGPPELNSELVSEWVSYRTPDSERLARRGRRGRCGFLAVSPCCAVIWEFHRVHRDLEAHLCFTASPWVCCLAGWVGASMCHSGTVADSQALSTTSTLSPPLQHYWGPPLR